MRGCPGTNGCNEKEVVRERRKRENTLADRLHVTQPDLLFFCLFNLLSLQREAMKVRSMDAYERMVNVGRCCAMLFGWHRNYAKPDVERSDGR